MPKVCLMTSVHRHDDIRIYHKEAIALREAGYDITILCPDYEGCDENGIKFVKADISNKRLKRIIFCTAIYTSLALKLNCDIYHFHDPELIFAGNNLKKQGKTVIYDVHEDLPLQILTKQWIAKPIRKAVSKAADKAEKKFADKFDIVICATDEIAKKFNNSIVVHNYPKVEEFNNYLNNTKPFTVRENQVCYVGAISEIRGIRFMVNAIDKSNAKLILAGDFENRQLMNEVTKNNKKIEYKGYLNRESVLDIYSQCLAGLLLLTPTPSYMQSLPIKLFEYMLAGLPVIASDFAYWRQLIGENCVIYVNPNETNQIAAAINYIVNNPEKAQKMGNTGRQLALSKFTFESEKKRLLKHYSRLTFDK